MTGARLITRTDVLQALLAAVAAVPAGERLHIPKIRDALVSQDDVIRGIEALIIAGELDAETLRPSIEIAEEANGPDQPDAEGAAGGSGQEVPPEPSAPPPSAPMPTRTSVLTGPALADQLTDYARAHGLALSRVGNHLMGSPSGISRLRVRGRRPQQKTVDRIRAFLASPPPASLKAQPKGGPRVPDVGGITGAELAAKIEALIAKHGLSKTQVGKHLMGQASGVETIRRHHPRRKTVARIEAFLADPPIDKLKAKTSPAPRADGPMSAQPGAIDVKGVVGLPPRDLPRPSPQPAPIEPLPTIVQPGAVAWCDQCEQRVGHAKAAACMSRWCDLKEQQS